MAKFKNLNWITIKDQSAKSFYGFKVDMIVAYAEHTQCTEAMAHSRVVNSKKLKGLFAEATNTIEFTEEEYKNKIKIFVKKVAGY